MILFSTTKPHETKKYFSKRHLVCVKGYAETFQLCMNVVVMQFKWTYLLVFIYLLLQFSKGEHECGGVEAEKSAKVIETQ